MAAGRDCSHRILLASRSPRRRALLAAFGLPFAPIEPGPEARARGDARNRVLAAAAAKARGARCGGRAGLVLAADTVVCAGGRILGKPRDAAEARSQLALLFGRPHEVWTAVAWRAAGRGGEPETAAASARVLLEDPGEEALAAYLAGGEWHDKAGAYGIQGAAGGFARLLEGRLDTVVGLPMDLVAAAWTAYLAAGPS